MQELLFHIGMGLLGGLILNIMPCVLPVLTMKVFHLVEHGHGDDPAHRKARYLHGLAYTGGVLLLFVGLAVAVIVLKASGERVGWGMQFRNPMFVAGMTAAMFTFGLNALGVFEWTVSLSGHHKKEGYGASVVNGLFAAIMSTPCSAPFLGSAAAYALGADAQWWQTSALFLAIGFGLASPFLLISFVPGIGKVLPRPGPWMETFKSLMGFSLLAAAVWMFRTLQAQVSAAASADFLAFLLVLSVALWGVHQFGGVLYGNARRWGVRALATALTAGGALLFVHFEAPAPGATAAAAAPEGASDTVRDGKIAWAAFDPARVATETKAGRPVFMDFTANWCANCKTNEKLFLETAAVREALVRTRILPMKVDMTNENEVMDQWLEKLGRSGIPAYVIWLPDGSYDLLPEAITTEMVVDRLDKAAKRFPQTKVGRSNAELPMMDNRDAPKNQDSQVGQR
jgi:thiol:disulfide interchange protein DsbD